MNLDHRSRHSLGQHVCRVLAAGVFIVATSCTTQEARLGHGNKSPLYAAEARSDFGMVSSGSIEATRAGVAILEQGGNAIDAAVATALALGVSDPGGSGLGGMTYMLISFADGGAVAIDGSTPAPFAADPQKLLALKEAEEPYGYAAVSVPTTLASLDLARERYGTMELSRLLAPAIEIAGNGYRLSPNSIAWARGYLDEILASEYMRFLVLDEGVRLGQPGQVFCRPDLRNTYRQIAAHGTDIFYRGPIADRIAADMAENGGFVRKGDLALYRPVEKQPIRARYRDSEIIAYPPPGGGPEVIAALKILESFPSTALAEPTVERLHLLVEAYRIANADNQSSVMGTGQFPIGSLDFLSEEHIRKRAALVTPGRAIPESELQVSAGVSVMGDFTTHLSVADRHGNVVSMTQTLCRQYGSKVATPGLGFVYNSCLGFLDFENPQSPYYLRPRARYTTTMSPTIVLHAGSIIVLGSAGSDRIPPSVTEVISNLVDRKMTPRDAVVAPRVLWNTAHDPHRVCLEIATPITAADGDELQRYGFEHMYRLQYPPDPVSDSAFFGGVNLAAYDARTGQFFGVGDPRRNGYALGPRTAAMSGDVN